MFPRLQNTGSFFEVLFPKVYNFSGATAQPLTSHTECLHDKNEKDIQFGGSVACQSRLISQVSRETANQTGAMRGSCIRRLQSQ